MNYFKKWSYLFIISYSSNLITLTLKIKITKLIFDIKNKLFWWFLLTRDQVNASSITKVTSWLKFLGKNLCLVGCATFVRQKRGHANIDIYFLWKKLDHLLQLWIDQNKRTHENSNFFHRPQGFIYVPTELRIIFFRVNAA